MSTNKVRWSSNGPVAKRLKQLFENKDLDSNSHYLEAMDKYFSVEVQNKQVDKESFRRHFNNMKKQYDGKDSGHDVWTDTRK